MKVEDEMLNVSMPDSLTDGFSNREATYQKAKGNL